MSGEEDTLECRVCRGDEEPGRPLVSPCLCRGSISYCHQSCLEEWLSFSQKTTCELCHTEYAFDPIYADDAPEYVPALKLVELGFKKLLFVAAPAVLQLLVVCFFWIVVTPSLAAGIYSFLIKSDSWSPILPPSNVLLLDGDFKTRVTKLIFYMMGDVIAGISIICLVAVSFLIMMSFADFLRLNWNVEDGHLNNQAGRARGARRRPLRVANAPDAPERRVQAAAAVPVANNNEVPRDDGVDHQAQNNVEGNWPDDGPRLDHPEGDEWEDVPDEDDAAADGEDAQIFEEQEADLQPRANEAARRERGDNDAAIFFDDEGALDDLEGIAAQDAAMDAVEIRIALNDVLGFHGSLTILLRSTLFFFIFNLCYIWVFGYLPHLAGSLVRSYFVETPISLVYIYNVLPISCKSFYVELFEASKKSNRLIALEDLVLILLGYITVCAVVFTCGAAATFVQKKSFGFPINITPRLIKFGLSIVSISSSVLKVATLLFMRIFWVPLIIGFAALFCLNVLFEYSESDYIAFIVDNTVGFFSLAWVLGISFMLVITLSVLQLREVLHPDILARRIRPQEDQIELLNSLVKDGVLTHLRRVISSILIYTVLIVVFLLLPVCILRSIVGPLDVKVYYLVPNLQIPFEMAIFHVVFLSILEKHKNLIGRIQYCWLVYACDKLELTGYLLPVHAQNIQITYDGPVASDTPAVDLQVVERPPPGWDGRSKNDGSARWAFEESDAKSDVEQRLVPRQFPRYSFWRVSALVVVSWVLVLGSILCAILGTMFAGRAVGSILLLGTPAILNITLHDPLCLIIGIHIVRSLFRSYNRISGILRHRNVILDRIPLKGHLFWMRYATIFFIVIPIAIGFLLRRVTLGYSRHADLATLLTDDFKLGSVIFHTFFHLVVEGFLFTFMDRYFGTHLVPEYNSALIFASLLFVADAGARADNGLVINGGGEHVPIPKALFVPPYSVDEVRAINMWERLESGYIKPFLWKLFGAVASVFIGRICFYFADSHGFVLPMPEEYFTQKIIFLFGFFVFSPFVGRPIREKLSQLYSTIHNDMFLIGRKLRNFEKPEFKEQTS